MGNIMVIQICVIYLFSFFAEVTKHVRVHILLCLNLVVAKFQSEVELIAGRSVASVLRQTALEVGNGLFKH